MTWHDEWFALENRQKSLQIILKKLLKSFKQWVTEMQIESAAMLKAKNLETESSWDK